MPSGASAANPTVYIAGPMRGRPKFNFPAFDDAELLLKSFGYTVLNPARVDREHNPNAADLSEAEACTPDMLRTYAERDTRMLLQCTHIAMLPGWDKSRGATAEYYFARWIGLEVLDATTGGPLVIEETILQEAQRIVYGDRAQDYGHPLDECNRIAALWSVILKAHVKAEQIPLCMIGMKISREMNRRKRDNAVDIAGYAECLDRIHNERERRERITDSYLGKAII